ncbi:polymorphic toxin-type HINT domain-containing protein, partial [Streptomyces sp. NPDC095602]|uniref:polymorphic toxin-type HINT domain-containing protein n=1 Tax=Streptomyces sp. NPDC095602 TaxID=3155819 RepID=UPI0033229C92
SDASTRAEEQKSDARKRIKKAAKALIEIAKDELGINAAFDCVSSGDLGACGETLLNIAGSFAGGIAGKLLAKYGLPWEWKKANALGKRVVGLVGDLIGGVKDYLKASKAVGAAKDVLAKAQDKLVAAREKAAAARQKGGGSCPTKPQNHSFLPGTLVLLADGTTKPIGDKLVVTVPETGQTAVREVAGTIVTEDDKHFVDLTITGDSVKPEALGSATTHPFWVESENHWIEAGDLKPGMKLRTADGDVAPVTAIRKFDKRQRTHGLTLTDIHTYYVLAGSTPVLVHNCDDVDDAKPCIASRAARKRRRN